MSQETLEKTFNVNGEARLRLSNIRGLTEITTGSENIITVWADKQTNSGDAGRTEIYIEQASDGEVVVETRYQNGSWFPFGSMPCKVHYRVTVPQHCSLRVDGVSNETRVDGVQGALHLKTVSGGLVVHNIAGDLDLNSVSAGISGSLLGGSLALDTVSGCVRLTAQRLSQVDCSTVSGGVEIELELDPSAGDGAYRFHSVSGGVRLVVPLHTGCVVEYHSLSGQFRTNLPVSRFQQTNGHSRSQVNGGGPHMHFNSVSGSVVINAAGAGRDSQVADGPGAQEPAADEFTADESSFGFAETRQPERSTEEILSGIENGTISVEEALKQLQ